jgi:hypothetical protein
MYNREKFSILKSLDVLYDIFIINVQTNAIMIENNMVNVAGNSIIYLRFIFYYK